LHIKQQSIRGVTVNEQGGEHEEKIAWQRKAGSKAGDEWFLNLVGLKESLNWNLNGNAAKFHFT